ncbi:hypothetical protein FRC12_021808 [Ceratobasidium sp. 428]|nr:hypothetical protein FRC12_021808 [Ceratobasidium sp. 428]
MDLLLKIPELVNLIATYMSQPDQARFLRVSRLAFHSAVPLVWYSLDTMLVLFELIDGISYKPAPDEEDYGSMELPDPLTESHLVRFKFYAGFVKKVSLDYGLIGPDIPLRDQHRHTRLDNFPNWSPLLDYANKDVLLPNLVNITYLKLDCVPGMKWLRVLLSPSVRGLCIIHWGTWWPPRILPSLLELLASKSPGLTELNIFSHNFTYSYHVSSRHTLIQCLADFRELRVLKCNLVLFHPEMLATLGTLPHLSKIVVDVKDAPPLLDRAELPHDYFPSLRELCVNQVAPSWTTSLWSMKSMLKNLQSVSVSMYPERSNKTRFTGHWANPLLLQLFGNVTRLSSFRMCTSADSRYLHPAMLSLDVQQAMSQFSLESLSINNAYFEDITGCEFLSSAWLGIQELRCGMQKCQLSDLSLFARNLPHLRELELDVDLDFSGLNISEEIHHLSRKAFRCLSRSPQLYGRTDEQTIELAKYLCALWPNLRCDFAETDGDDTKSRFQFAYEELQRLNACISQVRAEMV